jgi:hypothetical protein
MMMSNDGYRSGERNVSPSMVVETQRHVGKISGWLLHAVVSEEALISFYQVSRCFMTEEVSVKSPVPDACALLQLGIL